MECDIHVGCGSETGRGAFKGPSQIGQGSLSFDFESESAVPVPVPHLRSSYSSCALCCRGDTARSLTVAKSNV